MINFCRDAIQERLNVFALVGVTALLPGCALNYPTDLKMVAIKKVSESEIPDRKSANLSRSKNLVLRVSFVSRVNLIDYAVDSYGIGAVAHFCNKTDQLPAFAGSPTPNLAWGVVYSGDIDIERSLYDLGLLYPPRSDKIAPKPTQLGQSPYGNLYSVYILTFRSPPPPGPWSHPEQAWDLTRNPHDVCLQIEVGKDYLFPRQSNEIVISASQISTALHSR